MLSVPPTKLKFLRFSARENDDGSFRGICWDIDLLRREPYFIVGYLRNDYYYSRKEAIRAAKQKALDLGCRWFMLLTYIKPTQEGYYWHQPEIQDGSLACGAFIMPVFLWRGEGSNKGRLFICWGDMGISFVDEDGGRWSERIPEPNNMPPIPEEEPPPF